MPKKKHYTPRYIFGIIFILPFLIIGYFFNNVVWRYLTKKKPFIEWVILVFSVAIVALVISGLIRGDFRPNKVIKDVPAQHLKRRR